MPSPFFSGRIPQDLHDRVDQHIAETGESKTDVLVKALAVYLNYPISRPTTTPTISEERLTALEKRVTSLESELEQFSSKTPVIKLDNSQPLPDNTFDSLDNSNIEMTVTPLEDPWQQGIQIPDNIDNFDNTNLDRDEEKSTKLLPEFIPAKFEDLTSVELTKQTGMRQGQLDSYKRRITEKHQKMGQPLENKKLLEAPEKIEPSKPIIINDYPYDLFYLGQNEKGNNIWTALPYDNSRYQQLSLGN